MSLSGKRVLLIIGGGIAAYKALELIREITKRGGSVRAILTKAGAEFVTPLSVASLSGEKVFTDLFSLTDEAEMGHIELSRSADLVVVAPATADLLAKMAQGLANDLASTALLATDKRVLVAPAMNVRMWQHTATQRNISTLKSDGVLFVGPDEGPMACGEYGLGRMAEPIAIADAIEAALAPGSRLLEGRHVLVTSGPTHEPIDPVRYIANRSSGKQGHAIAAAAARAGARVTLVSGPVSIPNPVGVTVIRVETAKEMLHAVEQSLPADIAVFCAAVADWHVASQSGDKLKKTDAGPPALSLMPNPDILSTIAHRATGRPSLIVGFAAETTNVLDYARSKLDKKACDLIVANDVSGESGVMGGDMNTVHLVSKDAIDSWPKLSKREIAERLIALFATKFAKTSRP
jgi:phosphopantothenoylcysteine decarboxylase/phosphopantothenate--cysteine ligase